MQLLKVKICVNMYIKKEQEKKGKYIIEYFNLFIFKCMNEK